MMNKTGKLLGAAALAAVLAGTATALGGDWDATVSRLKDNTLRLRFRGALGERMGAGFFVDTNGWVLTNFSVAEGARQGYAETRDGEKLPIRRVLGVAQKYNLLLLEVGGERKDSLELAEEGTTRAGLAVHGIGMTRAQGWVDMPGVITHVGQTTDGLPLVEFSGWRERETGGGPVADEEGRVHGIGTWDMVRRIEMDPQSKRYRTVPTERTGCLPAATLRRFLSAPKSGMALHELGAYYANAEVANWVMYMCAEAKDTMVLLRDEVRAAGMEKSQIMDRNKVSFREVNTHPIYWKNTQGILAAVRTLRDLDALAVRSMPLLAANDDRVRNAVTYFKSAARAMDEAVDLIAKSDGLRGDAFWQKYDHVKGKFLQINDFLFKAMQSAMDAYRIYGRYTTQPPYLGSDEARQTMTFLQNRGGGF